MGGMFYWQPVALSNTNKKKWLHAGKMLASSQLLTVAESLKCYWRSDRE